MARLLPNLQLEEPCTIDERIQHRGFYLQCPRNRAKKFGMDRLVAQIDSYRLDHSAIDTWKHFYNWPGLPFLIKASQLDRDFKSAIERV